MSNVAILLNLGSKITLEEKDPLMNIIEGNESLLFYDRLSIKPFPAENNLRAQHEKALLSDMRNLLEARAISKKDNGEEIRLIILADLEDTRNPQTVSPDGGNCDVERARIFRNTVEEVFGKDNVMLGRFRYNFVFVNTEMGPHIRQFHKEVIAVQEFVSDSTFFLINIDNSNLNCKLFGWIYIKSLVQLLCTLGREQYNNLIAAHNGAPHANLFYTAETPTADTPDMVDGSKLTSLKQYVDSSISIISGKKKTKVNKYTQYADVHREPKPNVTNKKYLEERDGVYKDLVLHLPFFFNKELYHNLIRKLEEIHRFESTLTRPPYSTPPRLTDVELTPQEIKKEMSLDDFKKEIEVKEKTWRSKTEETPKTVTWPQKERDELLAELQIKINKLRLKMKNLGILKCLAIICILVVAFVTLCFSTHLINNPDAKYLWILVCLVAAFIMSIAAVFAASSATRREIRAVLNRITDIRKELDDMTQNYYNELVSRAKKQDEVDVLRRNIDEMKKCLEEIERENKQVELWEDHYKHLSDKLESVKDLYNGQEIEEHKKDPKDSPFSLEKKPGFCFSIAEFFANDDFNYDIILSESEGISVNNAVCFVKRFNFIIK